MVSLIKGFSEPNIVNFGYCKQPNKTKTIMIPDLMWNHNGLITLKTILYE